MKDIGIASNKDTRHTLEKNIGLRLVESAGGLVCNDDILPQVEEGIIECRWVQLCDLNQYRQRIHPRINCLVEFWHNNQAYVPRN